MKENYMIVEEREQSVHKLCLKMILEKEYKDFIRASLWYRQPKRQKGRQVTVWPGKSPSPSPLVNSL